MLPQKQYDLFARTFSPESEIVIFVLKVWRKDFHGKILLFNAQNEMPNCPQEIWVAMIRLTSRRIPAPTKNSVVVK